MNLLPLDPFPQPEANGADTVPSALRALAQAHDEASANEACDAFLWAIGDNHLGTFHPVVLAVLPELRDIVQRGGPWAQRAVLESLIDLGGSFIPQAGHEMHLGASVQDMVKAFVHGLAPSIVPLAQGDDPRAASARELLELIDDQT